MTYFNSTRLKTFNQKIDESNKLFIYIIDSVNDFCIMHT